MKYNTQEKPLVLPEYGRYIQNMVSYACAIEDRAERQRCAETIVSIMENMNPAITEMSDYRHKLWDHLAIMADFQLDIDFPYPVIRPESVHARPDTIPYSDGQVPYRHYGRIIPALIEQACQMSEGPEREQLVKLIATQMKKEQLMWNKEGQDDNKIVQDIEHLSGGILQTDPETLGLGEFKLPGGANINNGQPSKNRKKKKNKQRFQQSQQ